MLSPLRNRFGIPGVISVIALVFAMFGGAYAATTSGGGKATASAKAKKGPRGPKGATGPAGPAGTQGAAGAAGAKGDKGDKGDNGAPGGNGVSVTSSAEPKGANCAEGGSKFIAASGTTFACNGKEGAKGKEGSPWTELGTLPPGETLTGTWATGNSGINEGNQYVPISFPLPLESAPELTFVWLSYQAAGEQFAPSELEEILEEGAEHGCPGFEEGVPLADPGHLCVYASYMIAMKPSGTGLTNTIRSTSEPPQIYTGGSLIPGPGGGYFTSGVNQVGTTLDLKCAQENCLGLGVWAATAEE